MINIFQATDGHSIIATNYLCPAFTLRLMDFLGIRLIKLILPQIYLLQMFFNTYAPSSASFYLFFGLFKQIIQI